MNVSLTLSHIFKAGKLFKYSLKLEITFPCLFKINPLLFKEPLFNQQIQLNELHAAFTSNQASVHQTVHEFSGNLGLNKQLQVLFPWRYFTLTSQS